MNHKQIDKLVNDLDLKSVGAKTVINDDGDELLGVETFEEEQKVVVSEKFLKIYVVVRPILQFVSAILPSKWRAVIQVFVSALDDLVATP